MNDRSRLIQRFLIVTSFFLLPLSAAGFENEQRDGPDGSAGEVRVAERVAGRTGIPRDEAIALKRAGLGWGDIEIAAVVSAAADAPLANVVELWHAAEGEWSIVADEYDLSPLGKLISEHKRSGRGGRQDR